MRRRRESLRYRRLFSILQGRGDRHSVSGNDSRTVSFIDFSTIGLQIVLPISLILWLFFAPLSRLGFLVRALSVGLVLLALLLTAVWMPPPWWTPYVYAMCWVIAVLLRVSQRFRKVAWLPQGRWNWAAVVGLSVFSVWAAVVVASAIGGRNPPSGERVVDLAFPMGPGRYLVASGGASQTINGHFLTLNPKTDRQRAYRGQSYAVDLVALGSWGRRASGWRPADPAAYVIFGQAVFAPCAGTVIASLDGMPDMPVPTTNTSLLEGNHVVIRCDDFAVLLAHFKRGSVRVETGDAVEIGQLVGRVGNSGQSTEPHLHLHAQSLPTSGPLLSGDPLFLTLDGVFPTRNALIDIDAVEVAH